MGYVIERRQAARPLGWPREVIDALLTNAPDAVVVVDEERQIAWLNLAAEELFGYSAQEAQGQPFHLLVPAGWTEADLSAGRLEASGRPRHGTSLPLDIGLSQVTVGGRTLVTAICRDA